MFLQPYHPHELHLAYCYRLYLRWRTYRGIHLSPLAALSRTELRLLMNPYGIRVLECASNVTDLMTIVSLQPAETISSAASKLKGRVSKWLRQALHLEQPTNLLSNGYFACTVGKARRKAVENYLSQQSAHHHYSQRKLPPTLSEVYELTAADEARLEAKHAKVFAKFHLVFATGGRRGVLGSAESRRVAERWHSLQQELKMALIKTSFLPDHVHLALRAHPATSPLEIAVALMNAAQEMAQLPMIAVGADRLWQASAYIGSYGDLASPQIRKYIQEWERINREQRA